MTFKEYIKLWEDRCYAQGIPDEAPAILESSGKVPSYKNLVKLFFKNDHSLTSLGYSKPKSPIYSNIKREEISQRKNNNMELI